MNISSFSTEQLLLLAKTVLANCCLVLLTLAFAEIVRDALHYLSHQVPFLMKHHVWHHRAIKRDMSPVNEEFYRESHWHHDIPEASVMLIASLFVFVALWLWKRESHEWYGALAGTIYSAWTLVKVLCRAWGFKWALASDVNHTANEVIAPPSHNSVNWSKHYPHHWENPNAYFSGVIPVFDWLIGTAVSLSGKTVAVTGATGSLGRALVTVLLDEGAKVIALSTSHSESFEISRNGIVVTVETIRWQVGCEDELSEVLERSDILILCHGINRRDRDLEAMMACLDVNFASCARLIKNFQQTVRTPFEAARKEAWIVTSEAEVAPAQSPAYENSKRVLGNMVTLARLDSPCVLRKIVPAAFRSEMNRDAILSAEWMALFIINAVKRDTRNIVVSPFRIWIYLFYPLHEWLLSGYYKSWSSQS